MNLISELDHPPRILMTVSPGFSQEWFDEIANSTPEAEFLAATDDTVFEQVKGVNAIINSPRAAFTDELLDRAGDGLLWVHCGGAGVEHFLIPRFVNSDITFTNGRIIQGPEIADHAMALLLALSRNLHLVLRGDTDNMPRPIELQNKTALIVGLGGIGTLVAERARASGMKVVSINDDLTPMYSMVDQFYTSEQLNEALPLADVVFCCAPFTKTTDKLFGKSQFELMKPSAYFINVSRGKLVDTDAITEALKSNQILGAGLDVTEPEPLAPDHALRAMKNVILTPHIAGLSDYNRLRNFELIKKNIKRFSKGLPLLNVVNKQLGY